MYDMLSRALLLIAVLALLVVAFKAIPKLLEGLGRGQPLLAAECPGTSALFNFTGDTGAQKRTGSILRKVRLLLSLDHNEAQPLNFYEGFDEFHHDTGDLTGRQRR